MSFLCQRGKGKPLGKDGVNMMTTKCRSGTGCRESSDLDRELVEVLTEISATAKRIADRLAAGGEGKLNMEGGSPHGKSQRIIHARG